MKETLVNRWNLIHQQLFGYVMNKVRNKRDAEDILQEIFIKASSSMHQLKEDEKFAGWIYRITHNTVIDYYRLKRKHANAMIAAFATDNQPDFTFNECVAFCLTQLMNDLPEKYRLALDLTEVQNVPQVEVAERLGISYSGAKSRVQRARQLLKKKLHELYVIQTDAYGNVLICENRMPCSCHESFPVSFPASF